MYTKGKYFIITLKTISFALAAEGQRTCSDRMRMLLMFYLFILFLYIYCTSVNIYRYTVN